RVHVGPRRMTAGCAADRGDVVASGADDDVVEHDVPHDHGPDGPEDARHTGGGARLPRGSDPIRDVRAPGAHEQLSHAQRRRVAYARNATMTTASATAAKRM